MITNFLIEHFSYYILFFWSILEGELGLVLAGFLSFKGDFEFIKVLIISICGALIGDSILFILGRYFTNQAKIIINNYELEKIEKWFKKNTIWLILFERFIYGTHIPSILMIGISKYPYYKFLIFDIVGVSLWAITFTSLGFYFGNDVIDIIVLIQKNLSILILILVFLLFYYFSRSKK